MQMTLLLYTNCSWLATLDQHIFSIFWKIWNLFSNAKIYSDPGYWLVSIWLFEVHHCWSTSALFPLILYHTLTAKLTVRAFLLCKSKNNDRSKVIQGWKKHNNLSCTYPIYSPFGFVMVNFYFMNFLFSPEILQKFNSIFYRSANLPFSKSASKKCPVFMWTGSLLHISHIFYHFQIVTVSWYAV